MNSETEMTCGTCDQPADGTHCTDGLPGHPWSYDDAVQRFGESTADELREKLETVCRERDEREEQLMREGGEVVVMTSDDLRNDTQTRITYAPGRIETGRVTEHSGFWAKLYAKAEERERQERAAEASAA